MTSFDASRFLYIPCSASGRCLWSSLWLSSNPEQIPQWHGFKRNLAQFPICHSSNALDVQRFKFEEGKAAEKVEPYCMYLENSNRENEAQKLRIGHLHAEGMHVLEEIAICYNITLHVHAVNHRVSYKYGAGESEVHLWWGYLNGTEHYQLMVFKADFLKLSQPVDAAVDPAAWKADPKQANTKANKQTNKHLKQCEGSCLAGYQKQCEGIPRIVSLQYGPCKNTN